MGLCGEASSSRASGQNKNSRQDWTEEVAVTQTGIGTEYIQA